MIYRDIVKWHNSLSNDCYRKKFIIDYLNHYIKKEKYCTILDIGSGTGFIANKIILKNKSKIKKYYALDINPLMHKHAEQKCRSNKVSYIYKNIYDLKGIGSPRSVDLIIFSFSMLEFTVDEKLIKVLKKILKHHGKILIFLPDILQDISKKSNVQDLLRDYISNKLSFTKKSKLSNVVSSFVVNNPGDILEIFTRNKMIIEQFYIERCPNSNKLFIIRIKKNG